MALTPEEKLALPYRPCVGVVLTRGDGLVFAGERIDTPDAWQMPQGGIEAGEEPRDAALRELCEEIGVPTDAVALPGETPGWIRYDLPDELVGKAFRGRFRGQDQKWFAMRLAGSDDLIRIDTAHPEFARWKWMSPGEVMKAIVSFKRRVYDEVFAALGPLL